MSSLKSSGSVLLSAQYLIPRFCGFAAVEGLQNIQNHIVDLLNLCFTLQLLCFFHHMTFKKTKDLHNYDYNYMRPWNQRSSWGKFLVLPFFGGEIFLLFLITRPQFTLKLGRWLGSSSCHMYFVLHRTHSWTRVRRRWSRTSVSISKGQNRP